MQTGEFWLLIFAMTITMGAGLAVLGNTKLIVDQQPGLTPAANKKASEHLSPEPAVTTP